jgi:uncharacterized protein
MVDNLSILHDSLNKKFYCVIGDKECTVEYDFVDDDKKVIDIFRTFVPQELRGQGIAKILYEKIIKYIDENHLKVIPTCSYALKVFSSEKYKKYVH